MPSVGGGDLRDCSSCPAGFRCVDGVCVNNSLPVLQPFDTFEILIGGSLTINAEYSDRDGDDVTITWTQVNNGAPVLLAEPVTGPSLTLQPELPGGYLFEVVASDGIGSTPAATLTVAVLNALPTVQPQGVVPAVLPGTEVTFDPQASDTDEGQTLVVRWTLVTGPDITLPSEADVLTFTPTEIGLYVLRATPYDGYAEGSSELFRVVVEPAAGTVFVSGSHVPDAEHVGDACGSVVNPCRDLGVGLALARAGSGSVMVAALSGGATYSTCIDLVGTEQLVGGFDPVTWEPRDELIERTVATCNEPQGHRVRAGALLSSLRLVSSVTSGLEARTLEVLPGSPQLIALDVIAPACGAACFSTGVALKGSDAVLSGVNVSAKVDGFNLLSFYAGITIRGGQPRLEGRLGNTPVTDRVAFPEARGRVQMNAPVTVQAWGILMGRAKAALSGLHVAGGLGLGLEGVRARGGDLTMDGNVVEITSFGSQVISAVNVAACDDGDAVCDCPLPGGDCSAVTMGAHQPLVAITNNQLIVRGATAAGEPIPCAGAGLTLSTTTSPPSNDTRPGQDLSNNDILLEGAITLGIGMLSAAYSDPTLGVDRISGNTVVVQGGTSEALCLDLAGTGGPDTTLVEGAIGMLVGGSGTQVVGNDVSVGAHEASSSGVFMLPGASYLVKQNVVTVADMSLGSTRAPLAIGVTLEQAIAAPGYELPLPVLAQNQVRMGSRAITSVGLSTGSYGWTIAGNMIHGGTSLYTTALSLSTRQPSPWPIVIHNTLAAGGTPSTTLGSRAVMLDSYSSSATGPTDQAHDAGTFLHNILDAGNAGGRRMLYDNVNVGFARTIDTGSVHQWVGAVPEVDVSQVFSYGVGTGGSATTMYITLLAGAGEAVVLTQAGGNLVESVPVLTGSRMLSAWAGSVGGQAWLVGISEDGIVQARVDRMLEQTAAGSPVSITPAVGVIDGATVALTPFAGVGIELDTQPADLVLAERGDTLLGGALWSLSGVSDGFAVGRPLVGEEPWGEILAIDARNGWLFVVERTDTDGMIELWVRGFERTRQRVRWNLTEKITDASAELAHFKAHDLGAASGQLCGGTAQEKSSTDLTLLIGDQLLTFIKPCLDGTVTNPMTFQTAPCATGAPAQVVFGDVLDGTVYEDLMVACDTGALEAYQLLVAGEPFWFRIAQGTLEGDLIAMAPRSQGATGSPHVLVTENTPSGVHAQIYAVNALNQSVTAVPSTLHALAGQGAVRGASGLQPDFGGSLPAPLADGAACTLGFRTPESTDPFDLTLVEGGACLDAGMPFTILLGVGPDEVAATLELSSLDVDLHGDSRSLSAPDIGADELP